VDPMGALITGRGGANMSAGFENFDALLREAKPLPPLPVAIVDAAEEHVLRGALDAADAGLIEPTLIGDKGDIDRILGTLGVAVDLPIVPAATPEAAADAGVALVSEGKVKALMKGHLHTSEFLHPILARLRVKERVSHVFVADLASYPKLLFITDGAINIAPDLPTKAAILQNAIELARLLGVQAVKAAVLSAVETVNPAIVSTMDAACLSKMAERGQIRGAVVDGPLAFDSAVSRESAEIKGIRSAVAGDADVLLVPDLVSGNILAKDLEYLAGATLAGIVMGTKVPVILTSRADPPKARLISAALASLIHHRQAAPSPHPR
jgi:phosphotransacetylase